MRHQLIALGRIALCAAAVVAIAVQHHQFSPEPFAISHSH
jgi:hypothetical protein